MTHAGEGLAFLVLVRNPELVAMDVSVRAVTAVDIPACFFRFICEIHTELRHFTLGDAEPHVDADTRLLQKDRPLLQFQSKNSLAYLTQNVKLRRRIEYDGVRAHALGRPLFHPLSSRMNANLVTTG